MTIARHDRPPELKGVPLDEIAERYTRAFRDITPDWAAFEDARIEGYKRAQHRFIGPGGSGKHDDAEAIPARGFTLSIMYVEPGQGNAAHTHEVEEIFFVLQGHLTVFFEDEDDGRADRQAPRPVGMRRLPAGGGPRLHQRQPGAGLFPGHARTRQARNHGLCRRRVVPAPRRPSEKRLNPCVS